MTTKEMLMEQRENIREIKKILVGNGKVGLCEAVRDNAGAILELETKVIASSKRNFKLRDWLAVAIAVIAFFGMVFNIIKPDQVLKILTNLAGV